MLCRLNCSKRWLAVEDRCRTQSRMPDIMAAVKEVRYSAFVFNPFSSLAVRYTKQALELVANGFITFA